MGRCRGFSELLLPPGARGVKGFRVDIQVVWHLLNLYPEVITKTKVDRGKGCREFTFGREG